MWALQSTILHFCPRIRINVTHLFNNTLDVQTPQRSCDANVQLNSLFAFHVDYALTAMSRAFPKFQLLGKQREGNALFGITA